MEPAESGELRVDRASANADALEAQAQALLAQAHRTRQNAAQIAKGNEGERAVGALLAELKPMGSVATRRLHVGSALTWLPSWVRAYGRSGSHFGASMAVAIARPGRAIGVS